MVRVLSIRMSGPPTKIVHTIVAPRPGACIFAAAAHVHKYVHALFLAALYSVCATTRSMLRLPR